MRPAAIHNNSFGNMNEHQSVARSSSSSYWVVTLTVLSMVGLCVIRTGAVDRYLSEVSEIAVQFQDNRSLMNLLEGDDNVARNVDEITTSTDEAIAEDVGSLLVGLRRDRIDGDEETKDQPETIRVKRQMDPGLMDLMERSKNVPPEPYNITAAICHKTIFGILDLWTFIDWAVYNHMLGFDHIYVSYLPDIKNKDGFKELVSLPYVTAWENKKGYIEKLTSDLNETILESVYTQHKLEEICLQELAVGYDWVMNADADEYLWFNKSMGVKQFLSKMDEQHIDYVSLGKWFYSPGFRDREELGNDSGFYLADYPFTVGPHCGRVPGPPADVCSGGGGRCKTIVKPKHHTWVRVHGTHDPSTRDESLQMPGAWGHFKEWPSVNVPDIALPDVRPRETFYARGPWEGRMVKVGSFMTDPDVGAEFRHDANISKWFEYVAHRR